jgi:hypothetical protein
MARGQLLYKIFNLVYLKYLWCSGRACVLSRRGDPTGGPSRASAVALWPPAYAAIGYMIYIILDRPARTEVASAGPRVVNEIQQFTPPPRF